MRQQLVTAEGWSESDATLLMRGLSGGRRTAPGTTNASPARPAHLQPALARAVEDEVIPRLLMARRPQRAARAAAEADRPANQPLGDTQVDRLVDLLLHGGQPEATAYVEALGDAGTPAEALLLDLLTPAARQLGRMWEDDLCTFGDVTIGLVRLGNVMRLLSRADTAGHQPHRAAPSALLAQMPGEQHGFGLAMVVQFFRRGGWNVREAPVVTSAELVGMVRETWFGIVGISVSCSERLETLADDIRAIRRQSRNSSVGIMVGGPPFLAHPQLAAMVGADATAADGVHAVREARRLVSLSAREP